MTAYRFRTRLRNVPAGVPQGNGMEWNGMEEEWNKDGSVDHHLSVLTRRAAARLDNQISIGGVR